MLYPKRTKFRKYHKNIQNKKKPLVSATLLSLGKYGIQACETSRISYQTIEAARRAISRKLKRSGQIWVKIFADIPITKKPAEVRMGKGKGNPVGWIANIAEGQILFEIDGVTHSNAKQAFLLAAQKLNCKSRFVQWS
uniref:Large ribosomal subunit protein uL16m n=2 Tax=Roya TaxID=43942 RepID=A0A6G9IFY0_9VIRI|nr:ribosomal protein L16 [Roya obtusa]YP_009755732.1 ribosomal protein L16 [Roya anglica]AGZ90381.1 ribosomal protein L16 [Roya obtusa]QIQ22971.1 ribosomal protein L16 [Roya anglica]